MSDPKLMSPDDWAAAFAYRAGMELHHYTPCEVRQLVAKIVGQAVEDLATENKRLRAETASSEQKAKKFLANLGYFLDQPMECGHNIKEWCDRCETCGMCEDEKRKTHE